MLYKKELDKIENSICEKCQAECDGMCPALRALYKIYTDLRHEEKTGIVRDLRKQLNLVDQEVDDSLRQLGEALIKVMPELNIIRDFDVKIGYVLSYEQKRAKGRAINAECRKVNGSYNAYLPFDFIVTFFEPNIYHMTENQKKVLMLHELMHIGIGEKGLRIEPHDIEDFSTILKKFGLEWNGFDQDIPDILAGGDSGQKKGTKGNKVEAKPKANNNGRTSSKSRGQKNKN